MADEEQTPQIELSVNTCFALSSAEVLTLRQDLYPTPDPISTWANGFTGMAEYVDTALSSTGTATAYWSLESAVQFNKTSCNSAFSAQIQQKTEELASEYLTAIKSLQDPDAELKPGDKVDERYASPWVRMFDYEFHKACPYKWKGIKKWYCMGRTNEDGYLQFAFMHTIPAPKRNEYITNYALGTGDCNWLNKNADGISIMLADKEASENFMLDSAGRIKKSVNPVLLGVISNEQPVTCIENANRTVDGITTIDDNDNITVVKNRIPSLFTSSGSLPASDNDGTVGMYNKACAGIQSVTTTMMLGFIYTIWGTIYKNTLYMVAKKLPIRGGGSFLTYGLHQGTPRWYRMNTAANDLRTDTNEEFDRDGPISQIQPPIMAADLIQAEYNFIKDTYTDAATFIHSKFSRIVELEDVVNPQANFLPVTYETFNVEAYLEAYGSDEDFEDYTILASSDPGYPYPDGLLQEWQGDLFLETCLTGDAGYLTCTFENAETKEKTYKDLALSYYSPKQKIHKYCPVGVSTEPDPEVSAINMLLFTYSGLFTVGDSAADMTVTADGAVTGIAYLYSGTKQPAYIEGGCFRNPSLFCLMGANQICCGDSACANAYSDGEIVTQQCGGPFDRYRIGNPKWACTNPVFHECTGEFMYCGGYGAIDNQIPTQWSNPGLKKGAETCHMVPQAQETPYMHYVDGSRPLLVGGSIVGGVNYICANVKRVGPTYSIQFYQGQAYNSWNSFYARIDEDITSVVASEFDTGVRGDLECGNNDFTALHYNNYAYAGAPVPSIDVYTNVVGFYPNYTTDFDIAHDPGIKVFVHSLDNCDHPEIFKVVVSASKMRALYPTTTAQGLHWNVRAIGCSKGFDPTDAYNCRDYKAVYMLIHSDGVKTKAIIDTTVNPIIKQLHTHGNLTFGTHNFAPSVHYKRTFSNVAFLYHSDVIVQSPSNEEDLALPIPYEDQVFYLHAEDGHFTGGCDCISIKTEVTSTIVSREVTYGPDPSRTINVSAYKWHYLHICESSFIRTLTAIMHKVWVHSKVAPAVHTFTIHPNPRSAVAWLEGNTTEMRTMKSIHILMRANTEDKTNVYYTKFDLVMYDEFTKPQIIDESAEVDKYEQLDNILDSVFADTAAANLSDSSAAAIYSVHT